MGDETITEADRAKARFDAALAKAREMTREDAATSALLGRIAIEERMIFLFMEYGSRGYVLSVPGTTVRPWQLPFLQVMMSDEETLSERLVAWARTGAVPPLELF